MGGTNGLDGLWEAMVVVAREESSQYFAGPKTYEAPGTIRAIQTQLLLLARLFATLRLVGCRFAAEDEFTDVSCR